MKSEVAAEDVECPAKKLEPEDEVGIYSYSPKEVTRRLEESGNGLFGRAA